MRYVIIGNAAAGIGAVEGIRQVDSEGEITIITHESHHTYSRPLLSYLLRGKVTEEKMRYRGESFYTDNRCTLLHADVTAVDADHKQAALGDGRRVAYDKLLVATGSSAFVPPVEGLEKHVFTTFLSLDDARKLDGMLSPTQRVLIIGAGLIGLKCAEGISARVAQVTVIDMAPRILSSILDDDGAARVQSHLESQGMVCRLSCGVSRFERHAAILDNGEKIDFDLLVVAAGVRPNTALLRGVADIDRGILINERSETSAPDLYAAGDCTQSFDVSCGQKRVMAVLPNAYRQGYTAGVNMAGGQAVFDKAIPMNAIGFFGLPILTAGHYGGQVYAQTDHDSYRRLFYEDNRLNGYILIGDIEKAGIYTNLIRERTPLDTLDFELICRKPSLMAFAREDRISKLGEAK